MFIYNIVDLVTRNGGGGYQQITFSGILLREAGANCVLVVLWLAV